MEWNDAAEFPALMTLERRHCRQARRRSMPADRRHFREARRHPACRRAWRRRASAREMEPGDGRAIRRQIEKKTEIPPAPVLKRQKGNIEYDDFSDLIALSLVCSSTNSIKSLASSLSTTARFHYILSSGARSLKSAMEPDCNL